jgi:uncharacterized protein (DUF736 family)
MDLKLNQIVLFRNANKSNDKQPDYIGSINVEGVLREIGMWARKSKGGNTFLLGSNAPPYKKDETKPKKPPEYKQEKTGRDLPF